MFKTISAAASLILFITMTLVSQAASAEVVKLKHSGLTLNGNLALAPGKRVQDGVILMVHGTLAHGRMEIMETLQGLLAEKGLNSVAITLSLGIDDRQGMYDCNKPHRHKHTDALDEIGAWVNWLTRQGARNLTLLGHSRGGNQAAWFVAERNNPAIRKVVLIAPLLWSETDAAGEYERRYRTPLKVVLNKAKALANEGHGQEFLTYQYFLHCENATMTADSFISYYAPDQRLDTLHLLPKIKQPVLLIAGTQDEVVVGLDKRAAKQADGKRVRLAVLEGADHSFRDLYAMELSDLIDAFLAAK